MRKLLFSRFQLAVTLSILLVASILLVGSAHAETGANKGKSLTTVSSSSDVEKAAPLTWGQWRGPNRDGSAPGASLPADLSELTPSWRVPLGKGYAGPIVSETMVYLVETVDNETEGLRALDRLTGEEHWRTTWAGRGKVPFYAKKNGDWVRSTPALADGALYVGGMEEVLHKIDAATGEVLWSIDFPARYGTKTPDFGFSSSPLVIDDAVFVQASNSLVKIDAENGESIWRSLENDGSVMVSGAFSSPIPATINGRDLLVVQTRTHLAGVEPGSREVVFNRQVPSFRGMNILTPTVQGDKIFTSSYRNLTHFFQVGAGDGEVALDELWTYKASGYMSSPVILDDHAYLHLGNGRFTCISLENGESRWTSEPIGDYASLVSVGDRILALLESGELLLLRANPEKFELLSRREIADQSTWGHLAIVDDQVFVRELEAISGFEVDSSR